MKKAWVLGVAILLVSAHSVFAEEEVSLEKIVVTPYNAEINAQSNPSSTDVISVKGANKKGIFTLTDAIKDVPGISYAISGGMGGDTSVFIRGANSNHTQVLYEGIKLYDPISTSGYFYGYNYMSLDKLEKIEVAKGPYCSLYGSDSIGGTINLFTKKGRGKPKFSYTQEVGSYQTTREKFASDGKLDKCAYSFSLSRTDVDGFYAAKYKNGNHEKDPFHNLNSALRLDYDITDTVDATLLSDYTYAKYDYDAGFPVADDDDNVAHFYQWIGGLKVSQRLTEAFSHNGLLGYTRTYRTNREDSSGESWYNGTTYQGKWQGDYKLFRSDRVVFGFDYLRELGESIDVVWSTVGPKVTSNTKGLYVENIFNPTDNIFFSGSYRIGDHSIFGQYNTYSVSGAYIFEKTNTKIKGSYGKGFKAPSLYQLFDSTYGNRDLNPEVSKSYEAGLEQKFFDSLTLNTTYFHTHLSNLIDSDPVTWKAYNVGKARIFGIENSISYAFDKNTSLSLMYAYLDARKLADKKKLARRPNNKFTGRLKTTVFNKLSLYPEISYIGSRIDGSVKLKSYWLANAACNYSANNKFEAFLRLENMLNKDYELVSGYQTPKFSWYLGAKYTF